MTRLFMVAALMFVTACSCYSGPDSEHFDGTSSFNKEPDKTFTDHIKWLWEMEKVDWLQWVDDPPQQRRLRGWGRACCVSPTSTSQLFCSS
ncbi:hypothetical protein MUP29_06230 [bacterium]|nr:hypothetical protein [bacterium]